MVRLNERQTYFAYNEGIDPKLLRLGSMVFDYANPRTKRPYYHSELNKSVDPPLITADQRPVCSLSQRRGRSFELGYGLEGLLDFDFSRSGSSQRLLLGKNGSKVEIIKHEDFLTDHILTNDAAKLWLQTSLSVASKLRARCKNALGTPKIWLLTGIYLMEDAVTYSVSAKSSNNSASATVPIPDPSGTVAALLNLNIGAKLALGQEFEAFALAQISGLRVWAAQWRQVSAKYLSVPDPLWETELLKNQLQLLDVWSMESQRSGDVELAEIELRGCAADGEEEPDYDEKTWEQFDEEVENLLEELE